MVARVFSSLWFAVCQELNPFRPQQPVAFLISFDGGLPPLTPEEEDDDHDVEEDEYLDLQRHSLQQQQQRRPSAMDVVGTRRRPVVYESGTYSRSRAVRLR